MITIGAGGILSLSFSALLGEVSPELGGELGSRLGGELSGDAEGSGSASPVGASSASLRGGVSLESPGASSSALEAGASASIGLGVLIPVMASVAGAESGAGDAVRLAHWRYELHHPLTSPLPSDPEFAK
ncbi:hypothetical protein IIC65_09725 [Candidatus Sumerlaeota bacterium]|nr:hypothetical protein [Candidatus Sumerlaeota bacterium]